VINVINWITGNVRSHSFCRIRAVNRQKVRDDETSFRIGRLTAEQVVEVERAMMKFLGLAR